MYYLTKKKHYSDCGNNQNSALRAFLLVIRRSILLYLGEKVKTFRQKSLADCNYFNHFSGRFYSLFEI